MAPRDPNKVQLDFPVLVADLIQQLSLTGALGVMEFSDVVTPVFLIGSRGIDFGSSAPIFTNAAITHGEASLAAANTVLADTGALPAGDYDLMANIYANASTAVSGETMFLQHRNAANNATLATLLSLNLLQAGGQNSHLERIGYTIALNERLRVISPSQAISAGIAGGSIFAQIRPTP